MKKILFLPMLLLLAGCYDRKSRDEQPPTQPKLTNNPSYDIIVTNSRPLLSWFNAKGGSGALTYQLQLDTSDAFDSHDLIEYVDIPQETAYISSIRVKEGQALRNGMRYYWRVKARDAAGAESGWEQSRFYVDTESDKHFMRLTRVPVIGTEVSSGYNKKNLVDLDDPGQLSFWQSTPPGAQQQWAEFDLGKSTTISRLWMLSNPKSDDGWLKNFVWQMSDDKKSWKDIPGTQVQGNDTFRNIITFTPVTTRYLRLFVTEWYGYAVQVNAVTIYSPGMPATPAVPDKEYVLIVGNQENGATFTELADFIKKLPVDLATVVVPHYEVSLEMVHKLKRKPVAIVLSGNNANYPALPMFEYNGEYELIRHSDIPILGICCGHQMLAMAYGYTFARSMGWDDITMLKPLRDIKPYVDIVRPDQIFKGIPNPFTAIEVHGWAVKQLPDHYELLAESTYVQAMKSTKQPRYGEQFHAEIEVPYNQASPYIENFLQMAKRYHSTGVWRGN